MLRRFRHCRRCRGLAERYGHSPLSAYLAECAVFKVDTLVNTPLISVDLELTGLDAREHRIIAIGWTRILNGRVNFASHRRILVNTGQSVGHSAAIHELMDSDVAGGEPLETGLTELFRAAVGHLWLFHHAALDLAFLREACQTQFGFSPPFVVIDTMQMELELRRRRNLPVHHGDLQLVKLRSNYGLPRYTAHDALIDACATAELMLAIAATMNPAGPLNLRPHVRYH